MQGTLRGTAADRSPRRISGWRRLALGAAIFGASTLILWADLPQQHISTEQVTPLWDAFPGWTYDQRGSFDTPTHAGVSPDGSRIYALRHGLVAAFNAADGIQAWDSAAVLGAPREIAVSTGDQVVVLYSRGTEVFVVAFDGETGAQLWRQQVATAESAVSVFSLAVSSAGLAVATWDQGISGIGNVQSMAALDLANGAPAWAMTLPPGATGAVDLEFSPDGSRIFALSTAFISGWSAFRVDAFTAASGVPQWHQTWVNGYFGETQFIPLGNSTPVDLDVSPDGSSVVAAGFTRSLCFPETSPVSSVAEGEVKIAAFAYDTATGEEQWRYLPDAEGGSTSGDPCQEGSDVVVDVEISPAGMVIMAGQSLPPDPLTSLAYDRFTVAVDLGSGSTLWANRAGRQGGGGLQSYLELTPDGSMAVVAGSGRIGTGDFGCPFSDGAEAVGISTADGTTVWNDLWTLGCEFGGLFYQDAVLSPDGGTMYGVALSQSVAQWLTALEFGGAPPPVDATPPVIDPVSDVTVEATSPDGTIVAYAVPAATDDVDGDVPVECAPASATLFPVGQTTVTCTAADAAGNTAETQFLVTVNAFVPQADLGVTVLPLVSERQAVGAPVAYVASVHNAGPDAAGVSLTVELQYREQAAWGAVPPTAAINGIFFMELGQLSAGQTVQVPFEVVYQAFGTQAVSAVVSGGHTELAPADNAAFFNQVVDLPFDAPGVQTGGFDVPAEYVTDGVGLAVVGVRVPGALIAGAPEWDLFLPADLTSATLLAGNQFVPGQHFVAGSHFVPSELFVPGDISLADPLDSFDPGDIFVAHSDVWLSGRAFVPAIDDWNPDGRLLFRDGRGHGSTNLRVTHRGDTTLQIGHASSSKWGEGGLEVVAEGGAADAVIGLCGDGFAAGLGHGDGAAFKCGSLTTEVLTGAIVVQLADGTLLDVPEGATVHIDEQATGGWHISVVAGSGVIATVGAASFTLDEGDTFDSANPPSPNLPPVAIAGGPYLGAVNTSIALDGTASSDPNGDALSHAWSAAEGGSFDAAASPSPAFSAPAAGIYPVTLVVCDPSAACDTNETSVVVYDPSAGFVTGGGWIDSPPGSCGPGAPNGVCAGDATGRANFGFVAKYKRGATVPDGQTEFVFQAGNLNFHSAAYDWLVVAGKDRAQFKGAGSINGVAGYEFMLTAYDGAAAGARDGFRIKIWAADSLVYDNRAGMDDEPSQGNTLPISGGSIVIHPKR
jgi:hypothetical protein